METTLTSTSSELLIGYWQTVEAPSPLVVSVPVSYALPYQIEIQRFDFDRRPLYKPVPVVVEERVLADLYAHFAEEDQALAEIGLTEYGQLLADSED